LTWDFAAAAEELMKVAIDRKLRMRNLRKLL
jgi:hypothetical protein